MTEVKDNTQKKLTLSGKKLHFNKALEPTSITKNVSSSGNNTIVEVKKSKVSNLSLSKHTLSLNKPGQRSTVSDANVEFSKRINLLKKAVEDSKQELDEVQFIGLSDLAKLNQTITPTKEQNEQLAVENTEPQATLIPESQDVKKQNTPEIKKLQNNNDNKAFASVTDDEVVATKKKLSDNKTVAQKPRLEETKKLKKSQILHLLDDDASDAWTKTRSLASIKRAKEKEKRKIAEQQKQEKVYREVLLPESISVGELANRMTERVADVIRELMKLGVIANSSQMIDAETAELIASGFGHTVKLVQESDVENILIAEQDNPEDLVARAPVVTVMGHVDHGKTSLLDALKSTDVALSEMGGITQHIGAYKVRLANNKSITFIDTPGHEAFTEMRVRGAKVTDIVVLVVAADDGIKAQTIEAIHHAKAANVPIIVAINKIDKPDINLERIKSELLREELIAEDLGGDTMIIPVSALKKTNLDKLEEAILLIAEMQDLKANPNAKASGTVIEARVDKAQGVVATILVQRGTLKKGDLIVAGQSYGKVKRINDDKATTVVEAGPSEPVEIYGLNQAPKAGDEFNIVQNEKQARDITEYRARKSKQKNTAVTSKTNLSEANLHNLFLKAAGNQHFKELRLIIKCDVHGSIEAISSSLLKIPTDDEVKLKILHSGIGGITESDVALAQASNAIIIGFNVRANSNVVSLPEKDKVDIRYYSIIYDLLDDVKSIMSGMLSPVIREEYIGSVEIRQVFNITKSGKIAGSYVTKGVIKKGAGVRLLRDNIVIHEGKLKTLKRFKDEVKEVRENFECGIAFEDYEDIKVGDMVEVFEVIQEKRQL